MTLDTIMTRSVVTVGMDDTLETVRGMFESRGFHHMVVLDGGRIVGLVSDRDLLRNLSPFVGRLSERKQDADSLRRRVHQIMSRKLIWGTPTTPVQEAAGIMLRHNVSCLPVLDEQGSLVGIVTDRDVMRWLAEKAVCQPKSAAA